MKTVTGAKLARTLEKHDWKLLRINGSHHIYGKSGIHGNQALKTGLLQHLLKVAGLNEDDIV